MNVRVRPYQLVIQVLATLFLGDVKAAREPLKSVSIFESCGDKIEVFQYDGYRVDILGAALSDLRSECEVTFYGRSGSSVFYSVKNVKNNAERVVVYIKTRSDYPSPAHYITKEAIDHRWRQHTIPFLQKKPASGGISTIIKMIRSSGRSRDFSMTVEIFGEDYHKTVDPYGKGKQVALAVGIIAGIIVVFVVYSLAIRVIRPFCCDRRRRKRTPDTQQMATQDRDCGSQESSPTIPMDSINVSSSTVSSHQYVPTLPPVQRNPYTGNIESYSGERDEYTDLLRDAASNPHHAQSGQSRHSQRWGANSSLDVEMLTSDNRRDDDPPSYDTIISRTPQLSITAPDDCLPTYDDAVKFSHS